jgi:hypothetical protein
VEANRITTIVVALPLSFHTYTLSLLALPLISLSLSQDAFCSIPCIATADLGW